MRKLLVFLLLAGTGNLVNGQSFLNTSTKVYLVRHGEKETGNDPLLTRAGQQRAGDLLQELKKKNIQRIYVTRYRRTQMTGDSLRIQLGIDTVHYKADTIGDDLVKKIIEKGDIGKTILVIGHSNTIPKLVRRLDSPAYPATDIPDNVYDNLYFIKFKKNKAKIKQLKYGAASQPSAPMSTNR